MKFFGDPPDTPTRAARPSAENDATDPLETVVSRGEDLARRAAFMQRFLTLQHLALLRRFADGLGVDQLVATLRDLNQTTAESFAATKLRSRHDWLKSA